MLTALRSLATVDVLCVSPGAQTAMSLSNHGDVRCVTATLSKADGFLFRLTPKKDFTEQLEQLLGSSLNVYSVIVGRYVWGICQLSISPKIKTLVDLDDYRFRFSDQYGWSVKSAIERMKKIVGHALLRRSLHRFSGAFVASSRDLIEISQSSDLQTCFLPNVAPHPAEEKSVQTVAGQVLFVGSLWYGPNAHGVNWLLREVWPIVRSKVNNAKLILVGSVSKEARSLWGVHTGVQVAGFVDDLALTYAHSSVVVVPIQAGGGSNIKVLEALFHKRPCVVSTFVSSAFEPHLQPVVHFRAAETPTQFAEQICEVLQQESREIEEARIRRAYEVVKSTFVPVVFHSAVRQFALEVISQASKGDR